MKQIHSKKVLFLAIMIIAGLMSCEDYLEEDNRSFVDTEAFYTSPDGMDALITAAYASNKIWYGKEEGFDFTVAGTDIYDYGQQHPFQYQYTFNRNNFNSTNSRLVILWVELYRGINACNEAIDVLSDPGRTPFDEAESAKKMAEVRFLRAHYNWLIVETWGGAVLRTEPIVGVVKTATRSSVEEFYEVIFDDLDYAVNNLDPGDNMSDSEYGRVTHYAARAFRARMHLTRGSQLDDQTHYAAAAEDAAAVINSGNYTLYDNYEDVWNIDNNTTNTEAVWSVNYSRSSFALLGVDVESYTEYQREGDKPWDEREGGHHGHLMFGQQYDVIPGMQRDIENGRPFRRYFANKYLIDAFNEDVDERFYGSFKTVWISNNPLLDLEEDEDEVEDPEEEPFKWPIEGQNYHTDESDPLYGEHFFEVGDTAILITKETFDDDVMLQSDVLVPDYHFNLEKGYWVFDYKRLFNEDGTANENGSNDRNNTFELSKFADPTRDAATDAGSQNGIRDSYVLRISEMYLNAAEALWRTGTGAASAYNDYLIPLADKRSFDGDGEALLASYGINSGADLTIEFFLDERARELCGEQLRWFDLKRMGSDMFISRMKQYAGNTAARNNFDEHFTLRPIPQVQFDAITNKDEFPQNPGY